MVARSCLSGFDLAKAIYDILLVTEVGIQHQLFDLHHQLSVPYQ